MLQTVDKLLDLLSTRELTESNKKSCKPDDKRLFLLILCVLPDKSACGVAHSSIAGVSSSVRGLITWQWAPDRGSTRQVGKLLSLTRRAALLPASHAASPSLAGRGRNWRHLRVQRKGRQCAGLRVW
jgi:hypothetical protein